MPVTKGKENGNGAAKNQKLCCTSCYKYISSPKDARRHPALKTLICKPCHSTYLLVDDLSRYEGGVDSQGSDNYCRWCLDGGGLVLCNEPSCPVSFCENCICRNFGDHVLEKTLKSKSWNCYICDESQLRDLIDEANKYLEPPKFTVSSPPRVKEKITSQLPRHHLFKAQNIKTTPGRLLNLQSVKTVLKPKPKLTPKPTPTPTAEVGPTLAPTPSTASKSTTKPTPKPASIPVPAPAPTLAKTPTAAPKPASTPIQPPKSILAPVTIPVPELAPKPASTPVQAPKPKLAPTTTPVSKPASISTPAQTSTPAPKPPTTSTPKLTLTPIPIPAPASKPISTATPKPVQTPAPAAKLTPKPTPKPASKPITVSKPILTATLKPAQTPAPAPKLIPKPTPAPKPTPVPKPISTPAPTSANPENQKQLSIRPYASRQMHDVETTPTKSLFRSSIYSSRALQISSRQTVEIPKVQSPHPAPSAEDVRAELSLSDESCNSVEKSSIPANSIDDIRAELYLSDESCSSEKGSSLPAISVDDIQAELHLNDENSDEKEESTPKKVKWALDNAKHVRKRMKLLHDSLGKCDQIFDTKKFGQDPDSLKSWLHNVEFLIGTGTSIMERCAYTKNLAEKL